MKIRNGFVSNSSSSSFVLLLPETLDIDFSKYQDCFDDNEVSEKQVKKSLKFLINEGYLDEDEFYGEVSVLKELLSDYVIAEMDVSSNRGMLVLADKDIVKKIMEIDNEN